MGRPAHAFDKEDPEPDALFYASPRFVTHIDDGAIAAPAVGGDRAARTVS